MTRYRWEYLLVLALTILTAWLALGERLPDWLVPEHEIAVRVARVQKFSGSQTLRLRGALMPVNEVYAVAPLTGRVTEFRVKTGDAVRTGAVLATIHASDLAQRRAELDSAL